MGTFEEYIYQHDRVLNVVKFNYLGNSYEGRGLLSWDLNNGFHIEAFLNTKGKIPYQIGLGGSKILGKMIFTQFE